MFQILKAYLIYMVYGLLIFFFVVVTPSIIKAVFYGEGDNADKNYSPATLHKVDRAINAFNFLASPFGGYADRSENKGVLSELAITCVIYMLAGLVIAVIYNKFFLSSKARGKPIRKL
jgi:hypothetical protein